MKAEYLVAISLISSIIFFIWSNYEGQELKEFNKKMVEYKEYIKNKPNMEESWAQPPKINEVPKQLFNISLFSLVISIVYCVYIYA